MKKPFVQKPIKPIHHRLVISWWAWLIVALVGCPVVLMTQGLPLKGAMVQVIAMLPALLFTPSVMRGKSPYALILLSMLMLIYLGAVGVLAFIRYYEGVALALWLMRFVEFVLLIFINYFLFVLLRRLPPMHKQNQP